MGNIIILNKVCTELIINYHHLCIAVQATLRPT